MITISILKCWNSKYQNKIPINKRHLLSNSRIIVIANGICLDKLPNKFI